MGTKRKPLAKVEIVVIDDLSIRNQEQLPTYLPYIDVTNRTAKGDKTCRVYFSTPSQEDLENTPKHLDSVINAMRCKSRQVEGLKEYVTKKINEPFSIELCQLFSLLLSKVNWARSTIEKVNTAQKHLVNHLASNGKSYQSILDITLDDWNNFQRSLENSDISDVKSVFCKARLPFLRFVPTSFSGQLKEISIPISKRRKVGVRPSIDGPNSAYTDAEMYQLLTYFLFHFYRGVGYLEKYNSLTPESMPKNWIYPGRKSKVIHTQNSKQDVFMLIKSWLSCKKGYQIILDHKLLYYKLGYRNDKAFSRVLKYLVKNTNQVEALRKYDKWEKKHHFLSFSAKQHVGSLYSQASPDDTGTKYLDFCLANIALIYTGLNKEVLMSWPSRINGKSILENYDSLFLTANETPKEVIIPGIKTRTGAKTRNKVMRTVISIDSPLYKMLKQYERLVKNDFDGPFFEMKTSRIKCWTPQDFEKRYPVVRSDGSLLKGLDTTRFRKVFASYKLLEQMKGTKSLEDLANKLKSQLGHESINTTFSHYLLKSQKSVSVMDIAIASITEGKINESSEFKGEINSPAVNGFTKLYLCECKDPTNPSHDLPIADECTHYDNCLGCKRSVISSLHLPYICCRILQYEAARNQLGSTWSVIYEDKWMIAHDALDKFEKSYPEVGKGLVSAAWETAKRGDVNLPPIFTRS